MKFHVFFKADNGFLPYTRYNEVGHRLCREFGPTLKMINLGGRGILYSLPTDIRCDMDIKKFAEIFSNCSVRMDIEANTGKGYDLLIRVPGYKEEWLCDMKTA
ncbi:Hypothetical protein KNT65_gp064 [Escherichia phage EcS1]|uniref:Uncharacterized protein n=1 Tax=Escherichia phage EcS1 TaxID=2083276 RepID=A0A2Z5ZCI9_9CAUD|nr:Hypothetical protein KNT65_gp064 [Escherichia phage EcS1]BBC78112.1 Hypothetical protein [Escherichia phage EcS1]